MMHLLQSSNRVALSFCNRPFYPALVDEKGVDDFTRPLKLLAHSLAFSDPLSGEPRRFESRIALEW